MAFAIFFLSDFIGTVTFLSVALHVLVKPLHCELAASVSMFFGGAHAGSLCLVERISSTAGVLGLPQFNFAFSRHTNSHRQSDLSVQAPPRVVLSSLTLNTI